MGVIGEPNGDASALVGVLRELSNDGYDSQLIALGDGEVRCAACDEAFGASEITVDGFRRVEVASDPDESRTVIWGICPKCSQLVAAVFGYGPAASPADQATLEQLDLDRPVDTAESDSRPN